MLYSKKDLLRLIIPLIIEQILAVTIGMADTIMVSIVGETAVSAVALVDAINILMINILAALATGGAVVCSQYIGSKDTDKARDSAKHLIMLAFGLSAVIMTIALLFNTQIITLAFGKIEPDVFSQAKTYFWLSALSYPFLAIYNSIAALFRSMNNSKTSMVVAAVMNVINIVGNAILIFVFDLGVAGAGIASLVSRMTGAIIMMFLIRNHKNILHIDSFLKLKFEKSIAKKILHIGIPNGVENGIFQLGKILVQGIIASFGTASIAANAVASNFASIQVIPGSAIGLAMITVVGQCIGAREYDQARHYVKKLMKYIYAFVCVLGILIMLFHTPFLKFYNLSTETTDIAVILIFIHSICAIVFWPMSFALPNGLRAANDVKFTMLVSITSMVVFRIGLSYVFAIFFNYGVYGVWAAMVADWIARGTLFLLRFRGDRWYRKKLI